MLESEVKSGYGWCTTADESHTGEHPEWSDCRNWNPGKDPRDFRLFRSLAPMVEQGSEKPRVAGSSPAGTTIEIYKSCSKCGTRKRIGEYYRSNETYHSQCKQCEQETDRKRQNSDKNRLRRYNLSKEEFREMLREQKGRCAICSKRSNRLVVDHDHSSSMVRGLLCNSCNLGIGLLGDTLEGVLSAAYYLKGD